MVKVTIDGVEHEVDQNALKSLDVVFGNREKQLMEMVHSKGRGRCWTEVVAIGNEYRRTATAAASDPREVGKFLDAVWLENITSRREEFIGEPFGSKGETWSGHGKPPLSRMLPAYSSAKSVYLTSMKMGMGTADVEKGKTAVEQEIKRLRKTEPSPVLIAPTPVGGVLHPPPTDVKTCLEMLEKALVAVHSDSPTTACDLRAGCVDRLKKLF